MPMKCDFLCYYFNSPEFDVELENFFDGSHMLTPGEGDGCLYYSEVYLKFLEKEKGWEGWFMRPLPYTRSPLVDRYFTRKRNEHQLFAFVFGLWWGLSEAQLQAIDKTPKDRCLDMLDYFLCNEEQQQAPPPETYPHYYQGRFLRWGPEELEKAETLTGGEWVDIPNFLRDEQERYLATVRKK